MCVRRRMNPCNFNQVGYSFVAGKNVYLVGKSNILEKQSSCKFVPSAKQPQQKFWTYVQSVFFSCIFARVCMCCRKVFCKCFLYK